MSDGGWCIRGDRDTGGRWKSRSVLGCLALGGALAAAPALPAYGQGQGQGLRMATPEEVGLSPERLERIGACVQRAVDEQEIAGAVVLIARGGAVGYLQAFGQADAEAKRPMREDAIFRIASMTKPITSAAVMMLHEEGRLRLADPVSLYLPEFAKQRVLAEAPADSAVPARQEVTIRQLLTHTSGLTYHWDPRLGRAYREAGITHGLVQDSGTLGKKMGQLARLPLLHQPGEKWTYGLSVDVLGSLVEAVSGMPLNQFLRERIFEPLGMTDTAFFASAPKRDRLAAVYRGKEGGGLERIADGTTVTLPATEFTFSVDYPYAGPRTYHSGGCGLLSTASDYSRFCQMLLEDGQLEGVRLLSRKSVELMTTDHVGPLYPRPGAGFGLGLEVVDDPGAYGEATSAGSYGGGGFFNTSFWVDPLEQMVVVFMAQKHPFGAPVMDKARTLAYQAIAD